MVDKPADIIRVLVVDDSAFMRKALTMMLESDPQIKVIATARDGEEGVDKVRKLKPDLVTMDIEMPRMDGLAALRQIMTSTPVPVMMISSLTTDGAAATLDALELGAVDFIPKQLSYVSLDIVKIKDDLLAKIKEIARRKNSLMARYRTRVFAQLKDGPRPREVVKLAQQVAPPPRIIHKRTHLVNLIAIGCSTGGPPALQAIIPKLPRNLPVGMLVAQHMPPMFTRSLSERLNGLSQVSVKEAEDGEPIEAGSVYIAPGGRHMLVKKYGGRGRIVITDEPRDALYKPSVNVMMTSVANEFGGATIGVILTGMGSDGAEGLKLLKEKGGVVIAQSEDTCVVYGMPRAVVEAKIADHISPIGDIYSEIVSYF